MPEQPYDCTEYMCPMYTFKIINISNLVLNQCIVEIGPIRCSWDSNISVRSSKFKKIKFIIDIYVLHLIYHCLLWLLKLTVLHRTREQHVIRLNIVSWLGIIHILRHALEGERVSGLALQNTMRIVTKCYRGVGGSWKLAKFAWHNMWMTLYLSSNHTYKHN